jgi:ATP phosphoribosyltransferase
MLTVALPKGGLLADSIRLLQSVGLDFSAFLDSSNRQLEIWDTTHRAKALLVRNTDVPVYVEYGQAQLGIVGYDILHEKQPGSGLWSMPHVGGCKSQQSLSVGH